ncbi:anthranilate phosphoribosyltransferase [Vallicoccus soli]|uniref:Anthranilate phosphoribosyltransferase n=1 Tax=Vallicoccus soli TaxID=2339232 RepID=A0A3A3Z673_9ACTN|nr:anthranilate phosphoribosyltransferase [Vallicoccus soli]
MRTWPSVLAALLAGRALSEDEAAWAMGEVMRGEATPAQVAGFVVALRAKGETVEEVSGLAATMLDLAVPVAVPAGLGPVVDIVGTGGDRAQTVNISTMAALVVAAAGVPVVKHGNRAASSLCGAADLLEELGVVIDLPADDVAAVVAEVGITFCFAPTFHASMRHAAVPRRELGVPTVFNFLGPLTNPARPAAQAVGCADARMAPVMAGVYAARGASALVFRGDDGLDELTTTTTSRVWVVRDGRVGETVVDPSRLGLAPPAPGALRGGRAPHNARVARELLAGDAGPVRDAVLLNAAGALVAAGAVPAGAAGDDLHGPLAAGLERAAAAVDSGAAAALLERWVAATRSRGG